MQEGRSYQKLLSVLMVIMLITFDQGFSQTKGSAEQDQIILLNDSAAALEDSDPDLSKSLTVFADEKEKEWEDSNANKDQIPAPITDKEIPKIEGQIKLLKAAALAIEPSYPLIAKGLNKMAKDMDRTIELEK